MSKVLIDRELLERAVYSLELAYETDTPTVRDICAVLATPSGTPEMPVKAYYHEAPNEYGGLNKSVGLEVRKEFTDAPLVLESDAMECIACLEGEIAKRDARIAEMQERFDSSAHRTSLIGRLEIENDQLRAELSAIKAQEPVAYTYASKQETQCAGCGISKHTPLRVDDMGGYVCLTCIDKKLEDFYAAPVSEAKAQGVVMPTVDQAMRVVLREMGSSKHIRGTSNWCADVGRAVLDEVARLNAAPAAPAADAGLVERVSAFLAKGVVS